MEYQTNIHLNQVGYLAKGKKVAILANTNGHFKIVKALDNQAVFEGESYPAFGKGTGREVIDEASGDMISYCDFSSVTQEGEYYLELSGQGRSYPFYIGSRIYAPVKEALLKGLYYQRCGAALSHESAGDWAHPVCHTGLAKVYLNPEREIEVSGGWHDAGDYGRYAAPGAISVADILISYELYGDAYTDETGIPESGNGISDALDEARVELEWLLKIQNTENGGVFHKVTTKQFCGMIMPEAEGEPLYALTESAVAAGDFAAVMAMASRIYRKFDEAFADTMLEAARRAWLWLKDNPDMPVFINPPDVGTGEYGDPDSRDERYWAAVELYRVTGEEEYQDYIKNILRTDVDKTGFGWEQVGGYATFSCLWMEKEGEQVIDKTLADRLQKEFLNKAEELLLTARKDGYMADIPPRGYRWGSNMDIMNGAQLLILAYFLTGREEYNQVILDQFHYILGRNPVGISYITGTGTHAVNNIHHRPSVADGVEKAVPGLLSGGPNKGLNDEAAKKLIPVGTPPAKCFIDHTDSYSTNEITIYWNTAALFVAAYIGEYL